VTTGARTEAKNTASAMGTNTDRIQYRAASTTVAVTTADSEISARCHRGLVTGLVSGMEVSKAGEEIE